MSKFIILYMFHRINTLSLKRLNRIKTMNPNITIIPCFGVKQEFYIPTIFNFEYNQYLPVKLRRIFSYINEIINWPFLGSPSIYNISKRINKKIFLKKHRIKLNLLYNIMRKNNMTLYLDFTPIGYRNLDLSIINWFSTEGKNLDFEYIIFYEWDIYVRKDIKSIYDKYTKYDAAFINYDKADSKWVWYNYPPGSRKSITKWLRRRGLKINIYKNIMAGCMISKKVLEALVELNLPYGFCEMRLPTILNALGFNCGRLNFTCCRYRPIFQKNEVEENIENVIFHPVHDLIENQIKKEFL